MAEATTYHMGIDPGATGGLVIVDGKGKIATTMNFDHKEPAEVLTKVLGLWRGLDSIGLEAVNAMPGQGVVSMFNFGVGFGKLQGAMYALNIKFDLVYPQTWQKFMPWQEDWGPKDRVRAWADKTHGLERFLLPGRRVPHQGLVDASGIAEYMRRLWCGELQKPAPKKKVKKRQPIKI